MRCRKFERGISEMIDQGSSDKKIEALNEHAQRCSRCLDYWKKHEGLHTESQHFRALVVNPEYLREFSTRLKRQLVAGKQPDRKLVFFPWRWKRGWPWVYITGGAGVALLIVMLVFISPKSAVLENELWVFSLGDVLMQVSYEFGDHLELEPEYNAVMLKTIESMLDETWEAQEFSLLRERLFWESLTDEELVFIEAELKKDMKS